MVIGGLSDYQVVFKTCTVDEACSSAVHVKIIED